MRGPTVEECEHIYIDEEESEFISVTPTMEAPCLKCGDIPNMSKHSKNCEGGDCNGCNS